MEIDIVERGVFENRPAASERSSAIGIHVVFLNVIFIAGGAVVFRAVVVDVKQAIALIIGVKGDAHDAAV